MHFFVVVVFVFVIVFLVHFSSFFFPHFPANFCNFFLAKKKKKKWGWHVGQCIKRESTYLCMWVCETTFFFSWPNLQQNNINSHLIFTAPFKP